MNSIYRTTLALFLGGSFMLAACSDDGEVGNSDSDSATETGDGDGDGDSGETSDTQSSGDGDGDSGGDGDGDPATTETESETDTTETESETDTTETESETDTTETDTDDPTDTDTGDGDGDGEGVCADGCGTENCGPCPEPPEPPAMVGNFSIDATEVTNGQYLEFLDVGFSQEFFDNLPAGCEFKNSFLPEDFPVDPMAMADYPVVGVDWCDAYAYCEWAGRELCGAIGGGPAPLGDVIDWMDNQWYRACTQAGIKEYPYGVLYQADNCNTVDAGFEEAVPVASLGECEGGYPGIYDMSGNVWEWTNSCNDQGECRRRGGSFYSDETLTRCGVASVREREYRNENQGFRCCQTM